jgi:hypothetical protein
MEAVRSAEMTNARVKVFKGQRTIDPTSPIGSSNVHFDVLSSAITSARIYRYTAQKYGDT